MAAKPDYFAIVKKYVVMNKWKVHKEFPDKFLLFFEDLAAVVGSTNAKDEVWFDFVSVKYLEDPQIHDKVKEYVCRINQGLRIGCWRFDPRDGELLFRIANDVEGVSEAQVLELLDLSMKTGQGTFYKYIRGVPMLQNESAEAVCAKN